MDLQASLHPSVQHYQSAASQLLTNFVEKQSQSQKADAPASQSDVAAMISSEVKGYSTYVVKKEVAQVAPPDTQEGASQVPPTAREEEEEDEEFVAKEDIVKAWRFGSTWVPMEADTFEPLATQKGVEVLGFFPRANVSIQIRIAEADM